MTIQDIVNAMFGVEDRAGQSPALQANNNPGNLVYAGQPGATLGAGGFARFATLQDGINAAAAQVELDLTRGTDVTGRPTTTLAELISSWSPPNASGNTPLSTQDYISRVAASVGIDPNLDLSQILGFRRATHRKG